MSVESAGCPPLLGESDQRFLLSLRDHPAAPAYNFECDDLLNAEDLQWVHQFEAALAALPPRWKHGQPPDWVPVFARRCLTEVPFYRDYGHSEWSESLPCLGRTPLRDEPERLIPEGIDQGPMFIYDTSGTTGTSLNIHGHPVTAACYLPLLRKAVERHGGKLVGGPQRVSIALVFYQQKTLTYPALSSVLEGAAFVKLNLHENQWKTPRDRIDYLEAWNPEILSGNPLSLGELARLDVKLQPSAIISTSMALLPALRQELEERFQCPAIDFYSMSECRCIASRSGPGAWGLLAHDVYVEILDEKGRLCPPGVRGEITLTGGRNPYLPLLRYRTGDFAAMTWQGDEPLLIGLEGRAPVKFYRADGSWLNNIDVTGLLADLPLPQFALHQDRDLNLHFRYRGQTELGETCRERLLTLFGDSLEVFLESVEPGELLENKWIAYTSDL